MSSEVDDFYSVHVYHYPEEKEQAELWLGYTRHLEEK